MAQVISVYLPLWPIDRLKRQAPEPAPSPEAPLVLAGRVDTIIPEGPFSRSNGPTALQANDVMPKADCRFMPGKPKSPLSRGAGTWPVPDHMTPR